MNEIRRQLTILALSLALCPTLTLADQANESDGSSTRKAKVSLVSSAAAVVPGTPFELALRFELESGWHIYWQNSGDSGLPPAIDWTLPEGFSTSEFRFPIPKRHVSPGDIVTNILKGEPVLLIEARPPTQVGSTAVEIMGKVHYLICADKCIREQADVSLELPVDPPGSEPRPANEEIFKRASRALPKATHKIVAVTPSVSSDKLAAGSKFELALKVEIAKGNHIQSDRPTLPSLIAADVFTERIPGIRFGKATYPQPITRKDKYLGDLTEFEGTITVRVPGEIDSAREPGPLRIGGVFAFQACTDTGNCFPPDALSFSLPVGVVASVAPANEAVAAAADPSPSGADAPETEVANPVDHQRGDTSLPSESDASASSSPDESAAGGIEGLLKRYGLVGQLALCFLYGLFINATPCVLPLLSIKVLGFVKQAHQSKGRTFALALSFGAGVLVFFILLGFLAAGLLTEGRYNILQIPAAVIGLGAVVMAMGLSMLGVFTLQPPSSALNLEAHITQEGMLASFGKGALAPVLGFACTGPFVAGAFGWATQQPQQTALLAFLFMGLGMASPYMVLGARPNWLGFLPKPGPWMITFERIMGFLLLAMVIWLLHPLVTQIGSEGLEWTLVFLIFVGFACWIIGQVRYDMSPARRWSLRGSAIALVVFVGGVIYEGIFPLAEAVAAARAEREALAACANGDSAHEPSGLVWRPWSAAAVEESVRSGKVVFVDFTASYCTVCKANKFVAIDTPEVVERMKSLGAEAFQADFSIWDSAIDGELQRFGRAGVPLNLIYSPGRPDAPIVLDTNLTKSYLLKKLDEAASATTARASLVAP